MSQERPSTALDGKVILQSGVAVLLQAKAIQVVELHPMTLIIFSLQDAW